jgi:hypothetical protein
MSGPPTPRPIAATPAPANANTPTPRPRPELPPMPSPSLRPAAAPPAPRPAAPSKRESAPFEFELPKPPAPPTPAEAQEPVWEAEAEAEVVPEESPFHHDPTDHSPLAEPADAPGAEATRLFAPDLLGRASRLPDLVEPLEPPPEPPARAGDFSFDDLDFEEPSGQRRLNQSQIFGENSVPSGRGHATPAPAPIMPAGDALLEPEALADPLYSQTTFLDPASRERSGMTPPPLPDLLADAPLAEPEPDEDVPVAEADTALDDELEATRYQPAAQPFSPDTAAALEEPRFERTLPPAPAEAATRLMLPEEDEDREPETPRSFVPPPPPPRAPAPRPAMPAPIADTLPPKRSPIVPVAPLAPSARASAIVDSNLLAQSVEKVAWEAFGSLSEQVVAEVLKRVESVVWEVVPQLCERLIREEIARLKAEMSE